MADTPTESVTPAPPRKPYRRPNGNRVPQAKKETIHALLATGATLKTAQEATGLSYETVRMIGKQDVISLDRVEQIKRGLRAKAVLLAEKLANAVSDEKIKESGLGETMKSWAMAMDRAGIGPVSHHEVYVNRIQKYKVVEPVKVPRKQP